MAKQIYVAPETMVLDIEPAEMLAVSSIEHTSDKADKDYEALSNDRRGSWGNLWRE